MSRPTIGRHSASFPPGFRTSLLYRLFYRIAMRSRRVRAFFYELPRTRLRMWFVARFFHRLTEDMVGLRFNRLRRTLDPDVRFGTPLETSRGLDEFESFMQAFFEPFSAFGGELEQYIDPEGEDGGLLVIRTAVRGVASGVPMEPYVFLVFKMAYDHAVALEVRVDTNRPEALEAVGLRE